ncbi:DEAD/DEAH box helicase [Aquirufa antheringensis]|uniref:DEAD/DEAH box helicase n=1 Tax=Aquirufa antheringensis TaxID=2516559 RepID=UPI002A62431A|nr:DEAD/DEAH box helicase [Aquirufa antheringensis]
MPNPMDEFLSLGLNPQLQRACTAVGYTKPTPIQEKAIPLLLQGHDLLGIAQTGTGKTAAYALPILMRCKYAQGKNPRALILAPTRELVMQIHTVMIGLAQFTDLRILALYGGLGPKPQILALEEGIDILVSTPGRFLELYRKDVIVVKELKFLILDEADKMMDMGFMPQIRQILEKIPYKKRMNGLFSATFPEKVENLSHEFLEFPMKIEITPQATPASQVTQSVYEAPNLLTKLHALAYFMQNPDFHRVMVFCRSKDAANEVEKWLLKSLPKDQVRVIHSNKGQNTRINAMAQFREGNVRVLVTTDVAARGIDIPKVSHVINFDVPLIYEDYVHRIGRTGRAEEIGESITFITLAESYHWAKIEEIIQQKIEIEQLPEGIKIEETPFLEQQDMLRAVDDQRKREDPDFKGAFHDKKWVIKAKAAGKKVPQKKAVTKAGPKGGAVQGPKPIVRNNRPGKNAKFRPGAASNKKKR